MNHDVQYSSNYLYMLSTAVFHWFDAPLTELRYVIYCTSGFVDDITFSHNLTEKATRTGSSVGDSLQGGGTNLTPQRILKLIYQGTEPDRVFGDGSIDEAAKCHSFIFHWRSIAERGGCFQQNLFVCLFVDLFVSTIKSERLNIEC